MKIFGMEIGGVAKAEDGSYKLSAEQFAQIEQASQLHEMNAQGILTLKEKFETEMQSRVQLEEKITQLNSRLDDIEAKPAAMPAQANGVQEAATEEPIWKKFNKGVAEDMVAGKRMFQ